MKNQQGFTLLELIVVVIIIAVLVSVAYSFYEHAIENVRRADVLSLMGAEISSQDRYRLSRHHYTKLWHNLDAAPVQVRRPIEDNPYSDGINNTVFFTRGKRTDGTPNPGFQVYFEQIGQSWFMTADRVGGEKYSYTLVRPFDSKITYCIPTGDYHKNAVLCLDMMGIDTIEELPPDPRIAAQAEAQDN